MVVGMTMCSSDPSFTLTWQPERNRQKYSCCGVVALGSSFSTLACCLLSGVAALARVVHGHAASPATQVERKASKRVSLSKAHPHPHMCEPTVVGCNGYLYTKETQDRKYHQDMKDGEGKPLVAAYRGQPLSFHVTVKLSQNYHIAFRTGDMCTFPTTSTIIQGYSLHALGEPSRTQVALNHTHTNRTILRQCTNTSQDIMPAPQALPPAGRTIPDPHDPAHDEYHIAHEVVRESSARQHRNTRRPPVKQPARHTALPHRCSVLLGKAIEAAYAAVEYAAEKAYALLTVHEVGWVHVAAFVLVVVMAMHVVLPALRVLVHGGAALGGGIMCGAAATVLLRPAKLGVTLPPASLRTARMLCALACFVLTMYSWLPTLGFVIAAVPLGLGLRSGSKKCWTCGLYMAVLFAWCSGTPTSLLGAFLYGASVFMHAAHAGAAEGGNTTEQVEAELGPAVVLLERSCGALADTTRSIGRSAMVIWAVTHPSLVVVVLITCGVAWRYRARQRS